MLGIDMLMKGFASSDLARQAEQTLTYLRSLFMAMEAKQREIDDHLLALSAQCVRIEANTLAIFEEIGGTAAAAPTDYANVKLLSQLPPLNGVSQHAE